MSRRASSSSRLDQAASSSAASPSAVTSKAPTPSSASPSLSSAVSLSGPSASDAATSSTSGGVVQDRLAGAHPFSAAFSSTQGRVETGAGIGVGGVAKILARNETLGTQIHGEAAEFQCPLTSRAETDLGVGLNQLQRIDLANADRRQRTLPERPRIEHLARTSRDPHPARRPASAASSGRRRLAPPSDKTGLTASLPARAPIRRRASYPGRPWVARRRRSHRS